MYLVYVCDLISIHVASAFVLTFELSQVERWEDSEDFLEQMAKKTGRLLKVQCIYMYMYIQSFTCTYMYMYMYIHID